MTDKSEMFYLRRSVELAAEALEAGDQPFGSLLVGADGTILAEDRNRVGGGDQTRHPEFELARWAATNLTAEERKSSTVYTSSEHCTMCAAAHGWNGLGRIYYVSSSEQLMGWMAEFGVSESPPIAILPVQQVVPGIEVTGPVLELAGEVRELFRRLLQPSSPMDTGTG